MAVLELWVNLYINMGVMFVSQYFDTDYIYMELIWKDFMAVKEREKERDIVLPIQSGVDTIIISVIYQIYR